MIPAARNTALRSQPMPNSKSKTPMTSCSKWSGTWSRSGPSATTINASAASPAAVPATAPRQPRSVPAASTMVNASTTSTSEATKAAPTAGAAVVKEIMVKYTSRVDWLQSTYTLSFPGDVQGSDPNADLAPLDCARRALFANDNCKETHCK